MHSCIATVLFFIHLRTINERIKSGVLAKTHCLVRNADKRISFSSVTKLFLTLMASILTINGSLWKRCTCLSIRPARKPLHDIRQLDEERKETDARSGRGTHARDRYVSLNSTAILLASRSFENKALLASPPAVLARSFLAVARHCPCYFRMSPRLQTSNRVHVRETRGRR